jgi:lipoprotein-releasing system permease protein
MIFTPFERMMAFRYLRARKSESFVSVISAFSFLGIMLGVATLIIVMSVMNGFRAELTGKVLGLNGHMNVVSNTGNMRPYDNWVKILNNVDGVTAVLPQIEKQALFSVSGASTGVMVRGLSTDTFQSKPVLKDAIIDGNMDAFNEGNGVIIGRELARKYRLLPGDDIVMLSPQGKASPFGTLPRSRRFSVSAIFDVEMYEYNQGFVFMPLMAAQQFFNLTDAITTIEIFTTDPQQTPHYMDDVITQIPSDLTVYDWRQSNGSFFNALQVERNVMFLILTLIILVAAFNIVSSMIMLVKDKAKDIAILRTIGASRRSMLKIFILAGGMIGVAGTAAGTALGIGFATNIETIRQALQKLTGTELFSAEIYFLTQLPAQVNWSEVISVVVMALVISLLATLYPAWRAAKLDPVEVLRYE